MPRGKPNPASAHFVTPLAARLVDKLPAGDAWLYELKWDGYRALLIKDGPKVEIRLRNDRGTNMTLKKILVVALLLLPIVVASMRAAPRARGPAIARMAVAQGRMAAIEACYDLSFVARATWVTAIALVLHRTDDAY